MDGIHDLGGKEGYGPVEVEESEPYFHERWEGAVFSMIINLGDNTDRFRHAVERIHPVSYLMDTYYGRWLGGLETKLVEEGYIRQDEINGKLITAAGVEPALVAARPNALAKQISEKSTKERHLTAERPVQNKPLFQEGDSVVTLRAGSQGHTRLPAYVRGMRGCITTSHGGWVFPDSHAHGLGENAEHLYTVSFLGSELWGQDTEEGLELRIDLFESYLVGERGD